MKKIVLGVTLVAALLAAGMPLMAHHSFAAEFDGKKPVTLTGYVTKVEWTNPHVWFYMDVKDESGKIKDITFNLFRDDHGVMRVSAPDQMKAARKR